MSNILKTLAILTTVCLFLLPCDSSQAGQTAQVVVPQVAIQTPVVTTQAVTVQPLFGHRRADQSLTTNAKFRLFDKERRESRRELRAFRQNPTVTDHLFTKPTPTGALVTDVSIAPVVAPVTLQTPCVQAQCLETIEVTQQVPVVTYETVTEEQVIQVNKLVPRVEIQERRAQVQVPVTQQVIQAPVEACPPYDGETYEEHLSK